MKPSDFEKNVKIAQTVFLSFASFVFLIAITYSYFTENNFALGALILAGVLITGFIFYANKKFSH